MENQTSNNAPDKQIAALPAEKKNKSQDWLLPASIIFAGILIAGSVIYSTGLKNYNPRQNDANNRQDRTSQTLGATNQQNGQNSPQISANDAVLGNPDATLTLIEFGDFQCPFCAKFHKEIEEQLRKEYVQTGKIKFVYKPLAFLDSRSPVKESQNAVIAAKCAQEQGKFWEMHDAIFNAEYAETQKVMAGQLTSNEGSGNLVKDFFQKTAADLKMNASTFSVCYDSGKYKNSYSDAMNEAEKVLPEGVGTPAVFLNGQKADLRMNAQREFDYLTLKATIDALLK